MIPSYAQISSRPNRVRVYIASPYASNPAVGVARQHDMWKLLDGFGFHPVAPLLLQHMDPPPDAHTAMAWDLQEVRQCGAVLRLPGHSPGADREVEEARANGIPVFFSLDALIEAQDDLHRGLR